MPRPLKAMSARRREQVEFVALSTIAEGGIALAGFATLAGAIRGSRYDWDGIFDVVVNSLMAAVFALLAMRFGSGAAGLRLVSLGLALVGALAAARTLQVVRAAIRDDAEVFDRWSSILGFPSLFCVLSSPVLALSLSAGAFAGKSALLFESALLLHVVAAALILLDVVRRNIAIRGERPAA